MKILNDFDVTLAEIASRPLASQLPRLKLKQGLHVQRQTREVPISCIGQQMTQ
jgi:hypothetical protein